MGPQVFVMLGFLGAGKTEFINQVLHDAKFPLGRSLIIQSEFGEEDPYPEACVVDANSPDALDAVFRQYAPENLDTVFVEYNGMWKYAELKDFWPDSWDVPRRMLFVDSTTVFVYNRNMRELVYDKLVNCDLVVFNRCSEATDIPALHSLVRNVSTSCQIVFEYSDGRRIPDTIQDELPYDLNADEVTVEDDDYAIWLRDLNEHPSLYAGKIFHVKCRRGSGEDKAVLGRHVMYCCAADIAFKGIMCIEGLERIPASQWFTVEAIIELTPSPVFRCLDAVPSDAPSPEISRIDI